MCAECSNQTRCLFGASTVPNHAAATSEFTFQSWRPSKKDQRNRELTDRGEIERDQLWEQIGGGKLIAFPNAADFLVTVVGGKPSQPAVGRIVAPIGYNAAINTNPFALDIQVLDGYDLTGGGVGSDCLELAHCLGIARTASGIQGEPPASTLVLGSVDQLVNAYIGVEPIGATFRELKPKEAAPAMAQDKDPVLPKLSADPSSHLFGIGDHPLA